MFGSRSAVRFGLAAMLAVLPVGLPTASQAQTTGSVVVQVTKAGFIVGVGGGSGVLTFQGRRYPFSVGGLSLGFTVGASSAEFVGRALNLRSVADFPGTYTAIGGGAAVAGGAGGVRLRNARGVVLELQGRRVGFEVSVAVSGATITMR
jgi:lipid-binding SYLF domain-containing protein